MSFMDDLLKERLVSIELANLEKHYTSTDTLGKIILYKLPFQSIHSVLKITKIFYISYEQIQLFLLCFIVIENIFVK